MNIALKHLKALTSYVSLKQPQHFVVAYSGGIDSHVLLHLMHQVLAEAPHHQLSAIHVNHGLNPSAKRWQQHCIDVCTDLGISLQTTELKLQIKSRQSLEAVARDARYQALDKLAPAGSIILLGQHQDDQLETFLLQLKRGAGPKGLSAMPAVQELGTKLLLRPLLTITQQQIRQYAALNQLSWVEDDSNQNLDFDRNFLRHKVLPGIQERWPGFTSSVARSASLCAEQQALLDEVTAQKLQQCRDGEKVLNLTIFMCLTVAWQRQVIRLWLAELAIVMPSANLVDELLTQLASARDAEPQVRHENWVFRRYQQGLYLLPWQKLEKPSDVLWQGHYALYFSKCRSLHFSQVSDTGKLAVAFCPEKDRVELTFGSLSQKFKPQGQAMSKAIKQWYKLWSIPPWERGHIPQLKINGQLVALGDMAKSADYKPGPGAQTFFLSLSE